MKFVIDAILGLFVVSAMYYAAIAVQSDFSGGVFEERPNNSETKGIIGLLLLGTQTNKNSNKNCADPNEIYSDCHYRCMEECDDRNDYHGWDHHDHHDRDRDKDDDNYHDRDRDRDEHFHDAQEYSGDHSTVGRGIPDKDFGLSNGHDSYYTCQNKRTEKCSAGCFCRSNFVRADGHCSSRETHCRRRSNKKKCPNNMSWMRGNMCTDACNVTSLYCRAKEKYDCYCDHGFSRIYGQCYQSEYCNCGANRTFSTCGNPLSQLCPAAAAASAGINIFAGCLVGCFCQTNYVLVNGTCLSQTDGCPA